MSDASKCEFRFLRLGCRAGGLLRAGRLTEADIEHISEEIESVGRAERRELVNRLSVLLLHL
ncbi:MAG: DUF29 family protein [Acetobacteraceae bacterium]|nr:DUF29 family protein [Acetobacteraceae bacterium]